MTRMEKGTDLRGSVLECGSPLPLWREESAGGPAHSKTWRRPIGPWNEGRAS